MMSSGVGMAGASLLFRGRRAFGLLPVSRIPHSIAAVQKELSRSKGVWELRRQRVTAHRSNPESCSLITTDANKLAAKGHNRVPAILDSEDYDVWLKGGQTP